MPEKQDVFKQQVKQKGFFNYDELYKFCFTWLQEEGYDISEDKYEEKVTSFGKEVKIKWVAKKKISDYFRNIIEMKWLILGMTDAEVEIEGQKQKTNKGEVKIDVKGTLERDYEKRWENKPMWKFLRGVYDKYIIRATMEQYEGNLIQKSSSFFEQIKAFLNLSGRQ
ncbi:hypothetical protein CMI37_17390 [Candidatus Pacearchaeota archaeon]|nr:hypothetical protein [Candidatus Pacearchaeota archaeon]|tara:strand:- start:4776 stop:5276 length:501 start_codon:yes stop_codon:yes gene_type:complete